MKNFKLSRIVLSLVLLLVATFTLAACGPTDQEMLDAVKGDIAVFYATGETATTVESDLTLQTTVGEYEISWTSSNTDVISNAGVVTQPEEDTVVTLTATITLNEASAEVTFPVTVLAGYFPADVLANIVITGDNLTAPDGTNNFYITTGDIVLPTSDGEYTISWSSANTDAIANDGTVTRPLKDDGNAMVILTATVGTETADFAVQVLESEEYTDTQKLDMAYPSLLVSGADGTVVTGQELGMAETVGTNGVTVTWESSEPTVIYPDGRVVRPELGQPDVSVTLTATLHSGDETRTKEFTYLVKARTVAASANGTIADMLAAGTATALTASVEDDMYVRVNDVTIVGVDGNGIYIADASGTTFVYGVNLGTKYAVGDVINLEGFVAFNYYAYELKGTIDDPVYMVPSTGTATDLVYVDSSVGAVNELDQPSPSTPFHTIPIHIEAVVTIVGTGDYSVFLVPADHIGPFDASNAIMIYYKSNIEAVRDMAGKKIGIDLMLIGYRTDKTVWYADFFGEAEDLVEVPLTDAEAVTVAKAAFEASFEAEYVVDTTLDLPTDPNGVTVVWSTVSTTIVDVTTGDLTVPDTYQMVTLTATLDKGDESDTFEVSFYTGPITLEDVSTVIDAEDGIYVHVQGEVTANEYYRTFFVQDATGGIAIYTSDSDVQDFLNANLGKVVDIVGLKDEYRGLYQVTDVAIYTVIGDPTTAVEAVVSQEGLDEEGLAPFQGQLLTFESLVVTENDDDDHGNVYITLLDTTTSNEITMKWDSRVDLTAAQLAVLEGLTVGDVVDVTTPLAWNNGPYLYFTDSTLVEPVTKSNAEMAALVKTLLEDVIFPEQYFEAGTVELPASLIGATVTYASESPYLNESTGAITMPTGFREMVTVTASITYGDANETATVSFYVGVPRDLFFSEYIEGSSNHKALEIYNPTNETVDLSAYYIEMYRNGEAVASQVYHFPVDAQLAPNDVYVLTTDTAAAPIMSVADDSVSYNNVVYYNGDDAVALRKNDVIIDLIGVVGEDPGDFWEVGTGSTQNHTLVRAESVIIGNTTFTASEWVIYDEDTFDYIGTHYPTAPESITVTGAATVMDGLTTQLSVEYPVNTIAGVTWSSSDDLVATVDANGVVTGVAEGTVTITATSTETNTVTDTHVVEVTAAVYYTVSFEENGGSLVDDQTMVLETTAAVEPADPTLSGYVFNGWFTDDTTFLNSYDFNAPVTANVTLYAKWVVEGGTLYGTDLFFSEYVEGSSYNKALEIYNPTAASVDLSEYRIVNNYNGNVITEPSSNILQLSGMLPAGGTVVIYYDNDESGTLYPDTALITAANTADVTIVDYSYAMNFNGDDAIALQSNASGSWVQVDLIGEIGFRPSTSWSANSVSTANMTLVRKPSILEGVTTNPEEFDPSVEWIAYAQDDFTHLGSHTVD